MKSDVKVTLIEQAFQSVYTRKNLNRVSLRQFVNRLHLLTQKPRIFLFYKREKKNQSGKWLYSFSTHGDVLYVKTYEAQVMNKLHSEEGNKRYYVPPKEFERLPDGSTVFWPEKPLMIKGTDFGIIIVAIEAVTVNNKREVVFTSPTRINCNEINLKDESEYGLMSDLWKRFLDCEYSQSLGVAERINERFKLIHKNPKIEQNHIPNHQAGKLSTKDKEVINNQLELLEEIVNRVYKGVCQTPLICNKGKIPPNLFFFVRYYDGEHSRFKNGLLKSKNLPYPYSLKMMVPKLQREHFEQALEHIGKHAKQKIERGKRMWEYDFPQMKEYQEMFKRDVLYEKNSCYPQEELDKEFWLQLNREEYSEIVDGLEKPFGRGARSFVDPAMMTGYIHYRSGVFSENGSERLKKSTWDKKFKSPDVRRLVYFHYLLSAAAPNSNYQNLGAMTVPLNIAGQPLISLVQATVTKDEEKPDYTDRVSWPRNFHFFSDIARHCVRKLRYHSKVKYKRQIEEVVFTIFEKHMVLTKERKIRADFILIQDEINHQLELLCRVWPYPIIKINLFKNIPEDMFKSENYVPIVRAEDDFVGVVFKMHSNPFFESVNPDNLKGDKNDVTLYLSTKEIKTLFKSSLWRLDEIIAHTANGIKRSKSEVSH